MPDKLYNPDYLYSLCRNYNLQPSKKYGQNYLTNPEVIEKIIEAAEVKSMDAVVEVGPGFGVLTFALAEQAKEVIAYEIEKKLMPYWQDRAPKNLKIIWGNVLKNKIDAKEYKVVANLPYQITSAVIRYFLESDNPPETMTLMVQKEVAERICAKKGDMSVLSVAVQYYAEPRIIGLVQKENFWPMPKVDSAVIKLVSRQQTTPAYRQAGTNSNRDELFRLVKMGFANRRKLLLKNLEPYIGKKNKSILKQIFVDLGLSENTRAQELGVEEWGKLLFAISSTSSTILL